MTTRDTLEKSDTGSLISSNRQSRGIMPGTPRAGSSKLNGVQIEDSHPACPFCVSQFQGLNESQCINAKKKMLRKAAAIENKEEEFFRMSLLTYQLKYQSNQKIMTLDYRALYKQVLQTR